MHACTQDVPACGEVPPNVMIAEVLREQAVLQRKLLGLGRVMAAAAVVLAALPWVLIGLGPWPSSQVACPAVEETGLPEQREIPVESDIPPPAPPTQLAWFEQKNTATTLVRAIAHANEEVLRAYERPEVTVHHVVVTRAEAEELSHKSELRTRIIPVSVKGGKGVKLLRLPATGWFKRLGLQEGDVLVRFNGRRLIEPDLTLEAYAEAQQAKHAVFEVVRDGRPHVLSVTWDG